MFRADSMDNVIATIRFCCDLLKKQRSLQA